MNFADYKRDEKHLNCGSRASYFSVKTAQMRNTFSISLLLFVTLLLSYNFTSHGKKAVNSYRDSESKDDSSLGNGKKSSSVSVGEDEERKRRRTDINNLLPPNTIRDKIEKEKKSRKVAFEQSQAKSSNDQNKKASNREGAVTVDVNTDGTTSKTNKKESSRGKKDSEVELRAVQPKSKGSEALDEDGYDDDYDDDYYDDDDYDDYDDYDDDEDDDDYDDYYDDDDYDDYYDDDDYDDDVDSQLDLD